MLLVRQLGGIPMATTVNTNTAEVWERPEKANPSTKMKFDKEGEETHHLCIKQEDQYWVVH